MADYIYMLETRLLPEQLRGVTLLQETARAHQMNLYLTGGAVRDMISGFQIPNRLRRGIDHKIPDLGVLGGGLHEVDARIWKPLIMSRTAPPVR